MAYLDPKEAFDHFRDRTIEGIQSHFPIKGKLQTLYLKKIEVKDDLHPDDLRLQHKAKVEGGSYAVPVFGELELVDNITGKTVDRRRIRLAEIPKQTQRYSYILDGQEYQIDNQWQLKPGAYTRRRQNGELETRFNVANKTPFDMVFDPGTKQFVIEYNKAKLPAYPIFKVMGLDDHTIEKALGKEVFEANKNARGVAGTVEKFYKTDRREAPPSKEIAEKHLYETFVGSKMRPEATALTLGKPIDHVNGEALLLAAQKLMKVQSGHPEDDRDSLMFKDLRSAGDFVFDKFRGAAKVISAKTARKINQANDIRDIVKFDLFNDPIKQTFHKNSAARIATQINPVEMVSSSLQTTIMGPGGIKSEKSITDEAKFVNPSHLGFLDPIHTPEGCFDPETEVFTRRGWVAWPQVTKNDLLACLVDGRLEFHRPLALVAAPFVGDLYGVDTTRVKERGAKPLRYLITPNHRVWSRPVDGAGYRIDRADAMHGKPRVFQTGHAPYLGRDITTFQLPHVRGNNSTKNVGPIDIGDWAEFMGWFLSEGHVSYDENRSAYVVKLFQSDRPGTVGCSFIEELLSKLPFAWSRLERQNKRMVYSVCTKQLASYLIQFGGSSEKFIPEEAFDWPVHARVRLLDALLEGDGRRTQTRDGKTMKNEVYTTTSSKLAEGVERLIVSLGSTARVRVYKDNREERYRDVYEIRIFQNPERHLQRSLLGSYFKQAYEGMVYCAEVPGGLVYVRRHGSVGHWSGNSKTGVTLRLPLGVKKVGNEPKIPLYNLKTQQTELVSPGDFVTKNVVLPDQVKWENGKPRPIGSTVKLVGPNNEMKDGKFDDAHYVMRHPSQLFNMTSNLIPFLGNTSGNRASMASRHIEQAISLLHREEPLVQVSTGVDKPNMHSFERVLGTQASHQAPIDGVVHAVKSDAIVLKGKDGKIREVHIYNNYPLNDAKSVLHSTPTVKVGDRVKAGQVIADTNFSKNGTIALGTNLRVAYIPFKGYNFEDGVVISESAAKKLASVHLYKPVLAVDEKTILGRRKFEIHHPGLFKKDQMEHIGEDGLPKIGARVRPGDPLILAVKPFEIKDRTGVAAIRKSITGTHTDKSLRWDGEGEGEVVGITRSKDGIQVHVKTIEPMQVGDKVAGRYGNKGIVTMILPDKEMPHTKDGKHIEVALNPSGVPGRMNVGQVLETAASKIAEKLGKPYVAPSFQKDADMVAHVQAELKKHGLSDQEDIYDPVTGQPLGKALVGKQHILKLVHQVDKKVAVAPGMGLPGLPSTDKYDVNLQPKTGQRIGTLGMYALLAHGAKANLREMQTWKGEGPDPQTNEAKRWPSQHNQVWKAIQTGEPLPTPKPTFAFKKFEDLLRGAGVNIEKKGHEFVLSPLTDKHILELTGDRVLPRPGERLEAKIDKNTGELKPRPGGLFDEKLTGGHGGTKWSRIPLAEPVPNPIFEAPIRVLTGLSQKDFNAVIAGEKGIHPNGTLADLGKGVFTGGHAIEHMLKQIDVKKELSKAQAALNNAKAADVDPLLKKVKYLRALDQLGMKPHEAYILKNIPVIPPVMRPASLMQDGNIKYADINQLYSDFAQINDQLKDPTILRNFTESRKSGLRRNLYDGVKAIIGYGIPYKDAEHKGLLHTLSGATPKAGFFQSALVQKRQDLTMRSTIVPEPALGLDEVGLPKTHALDLFRPFVVKKLQEMGAAPTPLDAQKMLAKRSEPVWRALDKVMEERPVLLKRDPALHKYSVQGFQAKAVEGNAIKIHPLVCGGFNADFDGDTMSVFVPISREAVNEAHKMKPTQNLFAESTGKIAFSPTLESALGIYKLSLTGKDTGKSFSNPGAVLDAVRQGKLKHNDVVSLNGKKTTPGRVLLSTALPPAMQDDILYNLDHRLDKKGLEGLLTRLGKDHKADFDRAVNRLKDLGNDTSFGAVAVPLPHTTIANLTDPKKNVFVPIGTHSLGLADFAADKTVRNQVLSKADKEAAAIRSSSLPEAEKNRRIVAIYSKADQEMKALHEKKLEKKPTNLFTMYKAGVKPGWDQYKQMVLAPMLLKDSSDRVIPMPVTKSYSEGLDVGSYWTQMHGARRGSVLKVQEVQEPGYMSKLLMNNTMDLLVGSKDCGTTRGIAMGVHEKDIHDRVLAQDFTHGKLHVKAGTVLTPDITGQIKAVDKNAKLLVRSPLKCEHEKGICQKCLGVGSHGDFHDVGTNAGIHAAHAVGERAVQLTLKSFHTGGVVEQSGGKLLNSFARFEQLTMLPKKIPNAASLAMTSGKIEKIEPTSTGANVYINGKKHFVGKDAAGHPLHQPYGSSNWTGLKVGQYVTAGSPLSDPARTFVNPHDLYKATGSIDKVQNHLVSEMYDLYKDEGIKRRHIETVVKAMSNLTKVVHPGDAVGVLRGEFQPLSVVQKQNSELVKAGRRPIEHTPVLKGINMMPLSLQEDWMAKLQHQKLRSTIAEAAALGSRSNIHGTHPIPAIAYGAELGLTRAHHLRPGFGHLKDVPEHHY